MSPLFTVFCILCIRPTCSLHNLPGHFFSESQMTTRVSQGKVKVKEGRKDCFDCEIKINCR